MPIDRTLREGWTFEYTTGDLAKASAAKLQFHTERLKWWEEQKAAVLTKIRAEGIEVDESIADRKASYSNASRSTTVAIDQAMERDLDEAATKVREHREHVRTYDGWRQLFDAQSGKILALTQVDWLFFFGK